MRIDLSVNFKDKDIVKHLGARWDISRRVWYVEDIENLTPFLPWISEKLRNPTSIKVNQRGSSKKKNSKKLSRKSSSRKVLQETEKSPPEQIVRMDQPRKDIHSAAFDSCEINLIEPYPQELLDPPQAIRFNLPDGYYCGPRFNTHIRYGVLHHEHKPSVTNKTTKTTSWWLYGLRHRYDGPAIERPEGLCEWYWLGLRHRESGPAVENRATGHQEYWNHGKRHRIGGPAVIRANQTCEWWIDGMHVTTEQLAEMVAAIEIKRITRLSFLRPNWHEKFLGANNVITQKFLTSPTQPNQ